jgi:gamma-glutamyl-gamma-aminobutyrate hydrolase PuuD
MTRPAVVALSQRVDRYPDRNEVRDAVDQALVLWLAEVGFMAMPVPNVLGADDLANWLSVVDPIGVVLSGGNDIGTETQRDDTERALIDWAGTRRRPVLGICRGMQMLAVAAGGDLRKVVGHVRTRHQLDEPFGDVNSFHDLTLDGMPDGYEALATSADGEIEAFRHTQRPVLGWMWHPEREATFHRGHIALAHDFLAGNAV